MTCKYIVFGLIPFVIAGCSIQRTPLAINPGTQSPKTGLAYNFPSDNFQVIKYKGPREDLTIKFKRNNIETPPEMLAESKKNFDSLNFDAKVFSPFFSPGGVYVWDNFFIDETEVTNLEYQEFLYYIKRDSSNVYYKSQIPKYIFSVEQGVKVSEEELSMHQYYNNPAYRFFPLVGISHNQAQQYCKWRSGVVTLLMNSKFKEDSKYAIFKYRLPSEKEWEIIAATGYNLDKYPNGVFNERILNKAIINPKQIDLLSGLIERKQDESQMKTDIKEFNSSNSKIPIFNVKWEAPYFLDFKFPFYVYTFSINDFGVYNMIGGVSEMVQEEGVLKGGSWNNTLDEISIKKRMNNPPLEVGFRCGCEVEIIDSNKIAYSK